MERHQDRGRNGFAEGVQSALFFESPAEMFERVFRELKPRTAPPRFEIEFRPFANADSFVRLENGRIHARISDLFAGAPAPVLEALAHILLGKLYRREVARTHSTRYRLYLNRKDVRRQAHLLRQMRGRKFLSGPKGNSRDLEQIFEELNQQFFDGLLGRPQLGWSRRPSRSLLGHFDPSHNAIIISRIFDQERVPEEALRYVMFHEMLHLRYPAQHNGSHRRVHTKEFREAEKEFPGRKEAKDLLKKL